MLIMFFHTLCSFSSFNLAHFVQKFDKMPIKECLQDGKPTVQVYMVRVVDRFSVLFGNFAQCLWAYREARLDQTCIHVITSILRSLERILCLERGKLFC